MTIHFNAPTLLTAILIYIYRTVDVTDQGTKFVKGTKALSNNRSSKMDGKENSDILLNGKMKERL